jgi:hypothetical protein
VVTAGRPTGPDPAGWAHANGGLRRRGPAADDRARHVAARARQGLELRPELPRPRSCPGTSRHPRTWSRPPRRAAKARAPERKPSGAVEALQVAMTGDSAGPHIGAGGLAELVFHYAHALAVAPSAAVYGELLSARSFAGTLLGRSAARQRPDLTVTAGWLAVQPAGDIGGRPRRACGRDHLVYRYRTARPRCCLPGTARLGGPDPVADRLVPGRPAGLGGRRPARPSRRAARLGRARQARRPGDALPGDARRCRRDDRRQAPRRYRHGAARAAGLGGLPVSVLTASDVTAFLAGMACIHAPGTPAASSLLICWLLARRLGCLKVVPSSPATPYRQYLARRFDR